MSVTQVQTMPPLKISGLLHSAWAIQVLKTALEVDLFTALKGKALKADELADAVKINPRAGKMMLDALVAMELVTNERGAYRCTDLADAYLCKDSDLYLGRYIFLGETLGNAWKNLTQTVRSGKSQTRVNEQAEGEKFFQELTEAIFPLNYTTAQTLAEELGVLKLKQPAHVLDLAAGSAVWSLPMAQGNKNVHVDALDFPGVLEVTRKFATKYGVGDRYRYLSGNWREVKLEAEHYDYIILGHILHSEGKQASEELLKYCAAGLKKGGTLIVGEFLENEDRQGPLFATLFAINMLVATDIGCVFTVEELKSMLSAAGLKDARRLKLPFWGEESPVVIATK